MHHDDGIHDRGCKEAVISYLWSTKCPGKRGYLNLPEYPGAINLEIPANQTHVIQFHLSSSINTVSYNNLHLI